MSFMRVMVTHMSALFENSKKSPCASYIFVDLCPFSALLYYFLKNSHPFLHTTEYAPGTERGLSHVIG